ADARIADPHPARSAHGHGERTRAERSARGREKRASGRSGTRSPGLREPTLRPARALYGDPSRCPARDQHAEFREEEAGRPGEGGRIGQEDRNADPAQVESDDGPRSPGYREQYPPA